MLKKILWLLLLAAVPSLAQNAAVQGHSFLGGVSAVTSGLTSSNKLLGIVPHATISVYYTGTTTLVPGNLIFSNAAGTILGNPFTSNDASSVDPGGWLFFAATGQGYDVVGTGGIAPNTYTVPVTLCTDCFAGGGSGGGGGGSLAGDANGALTSNTVNGLHFGAANGFTLSSSSVPSALLPYVGYISPGVLGAVTAPPAPVTQIIAGNNVTISPSSGLGAVTINAAGGSGSGCGTGSNCVVTNPTGNQIITQPGGTNFQANILNGSYLADLFGGIGPSGANCNPQTGLGNSGCMANVSPAYGNSDAPSGWSFNGYFQGTAGMQIPSGADYNDYRNGTWFLNFHNPLNPINGEGGGLTLSTAYDLNQAQVNSVMAGPNNASFLNVSNSFANGWDFLFYLANMPQYVYQNYHYGVENVENDFTGGITFLNYELLNHHANGDAYLNWSRLTADAGTLAANSEGQAISDQEATEDPLVFTGTVTGSPATGATSITVNATIGAATQGDTGRFIVNVTPVYSGNHFTASIGPETTGSATNSAIMPPMVSDSTQNFPVSTIVQLCYPGSDNGAGGATGCTAGAQPVGYIPPQSYKFSISAWSITSNVVTFTTSAQNLAVGQAVMLYGFPTSTFFNQQSVTVASATGTSFTANFTHANGSATEAGFSTYSPTGYSPAQSITANVVAPYTGTGGNTNGLPSGFCSSSTLQSSNPAGACYIPASGIGCLVDGIEYECQNYTYNSGSQTITIANMQFPHLNGVMFAVGGLAGDAVEDLSSKYVQGGTSGVIDETYPVAASLNSTTFYYVPQRTNEQYGLPTLGGSTDGGSGNGGTIANLTNNATATALCFSTAISGISNTAGVVTFSMNQPNGTTNPFADYNGLMATITTSNSNYNGTYAITLDYANVFSYTPSAPSGSVPSSGTISYCNANYNILQSARVASVYDTANNSVDGKFTLFPNTASFSGATIREPHYQKMEMAGTHETVVAFQPKDYLGTNGASTFSYGGTVSGSAWGVYINNTDSSSDYLGSGGTKALPTQALGISGPWLYDFNMVAPYGSIVNISSCKAGIGCSSALSNWDVYAMPPLPNSQPGANGMDVLNYDPNYQSANRSQGIYSGRWYFDNDRNPIDQESATANPQSFATVQAGYLVADQGVTATSVSAKNLFTTQSTGIAIYPNTVGTPGSTTYNYWVVGHAPGGGVTAPVGSNITTGNATLSGTNYNLICMPYQAKYSSYDIMRGSTTTSVATGVTVNGASFGQPANYSCFADQGGATSPYTPSANTTGGANIAGPLVAASIADNGISSSANPICANGPGGVFTNIGCSGSGSSFITSLTTTGTSGAATVTSGVLNIPIYGAGGFPITLGSTSIGANSTTTAVTGLTVNGVTLTNGASASTFLNGAGNYVAPPGGVASVSNIDGTQIISPTTGAVVSSLNLAHANTWTAAQAAPYWLSSGIPSAPYTPSTLWTGFNSTSNQAVMAAIGPSTSSVAGLILEAASSDGSLSQTYLDCEYGTNCTFSEPVVVAGASGSPNGLIGFTATGVSPGSAPSSTIQIEAPNSVTAYRMKLPGAQPTPGNTYLSCTAASPSVCSWTGGGSGTNATSLQSVPISATAPTPNQILSDVSGTWTPITFNAASIQSLLTPQTGCSTAGYVYSPQSGTCIAGGSATLPTATAAGQAPVSTGAGTTYSAAQIEPQGFGYTFYISGGTTYARNNQTGNVDYSNTDAGVVINAAINNIASTCGHLYFEPGIYNINSLVQETTSGYTTIYYGIGIPGNAGTNQNCQWTIQGDGAPPLLDQFSAPVQTGGVIFNVTSTALGTVSATTLVDDLWARPGTDTAGPNVVLRNLDLRFPSNQRGYETASDMSQASNADYDHVMADTAVAQTSLMFPVATSYGLTTTASGHEENYMKNSYAIGYYVGLDIQSEHTTLINTFAVNDAYAIDYGVRGGNIYHASSWVNSGWGECKYGLTLGGNLQAGSLLNIAGLDIEDAASGTWAPSYHALETNAGNTFGNISYSRVLQATGVSPLYLLFDGSASGTSITTLDSRSMIVRSTNTNTGGNIPQYGIAPFNNGPNLGILDNSPATTSGNRPMIELSPNLPAGGFDEFYMGQSSSSANLAVWGFWNVGSGNNCNSAFFGTYGSYPLTVDYDGRVGVGVALGTCPSDTLQDVGSFSAGSSRQFQVNGSGNVTAPSVTATTGVSTAGLQITTTYTVATLPPCNTGTKGTEGTVSDATTPSYLGTLTGGGSVFTPVVCNGTAWVSY